VATVAVKTLIRTTVSSKATVWPPSTPTKRVRDGLLSMLSDTWFKFQVKHIFEYPAPNDKDYVWHKVNVFTRWLSPQYNLVISFDTPAPLRSRLPASLLQSSYSLSHHDPYWTHGFLINEVTALQNESVWGIRSLIRKTEQVSWDSQPTPFVSMTRTKGLFG
jgi:hypothetical protein